jgi:hypothetical protein
LASFQEHIDQARRNIDFLCLVNAANSTFCDWQTTTCFYCAVHLINSHVAQSTNQHYRTHAQVDSAINPYRTPPLASAVPPAIYVSYGLLKNLSRRARYLISHIDNNTETRGFITKDKHFAKAVRYLDEIMQYIDSVYGIGFAQKSINCPLIKKHNLKYFNTI